MSRSNSVRLPNMRRLLTDDGELSEKLASVRAMRLPRPRRNLSPSLRWAAVGLVFVVGIFLILSRDDVLGARAASFALTFLITAAMLCFSSSPWMTAFFERITFPLAEFGGHPAGEKSKMPQTMSKHPTHFANVPLPSGKFKGDPTILYPQHWAFLDGHRQALQRYSFAGEMQYVLSFVLPIFGTLAAILFVLLWWDVYMAMSHAPDRTTTDLLFSAALFALGLFFNTGLIVRAVRSEVGYRWLRRFGQVVPGEVIGVYTEMIGQQETETVLTYAFETPGGEPVNTAIHIPIGAISPTRLPKAGAAILVLYCEDGRNKVL